MALLKDVHVWGKQTRKYFWGSRSSFYKRGTVITNLMSVGGAAECTTEHITNGHYAPSFLLSMSTPEFTMLMLLALLLILAFSIALFGGIEHCKGWERRTGEEECPLLFGSKSRSIR